MSLHFKQKLCLQETSCRQVQHNPDHPAGWTVIAIHHEDLFFHKTYKTACEGINVTQIVMLHK